MSQVGKVGNHVKSSASFDRKDVTILVVEDDRTHRLLMEKILKEFDFKTVPAENGLVALAKLDSGERFDLIIMDWDMPGLDGIETVKEIRVRQAYGPLPHIPVLAFTSNKKPGDREKCIAAGMDGYLPKDVWTPRWRKNLIDNLQGLIAGNFDVNDFSPESKEQEEQVTTEFDLEAFDVHALEQTASFLKQELEIAIEEYLEDAAAYIRDIKEGLENGDAEKVARGSHPLKSNSRGFGLTAVSQIAETINTRARKVLSGEEVLEPIKSLLPLLQQAFYNSEKWLVKMVKK